MVIAYCKGTYFFWNWIIYSLINSHSQPPEDALFAQPRLFRACVPPGMHRFRGNIWDYDSRPQIMKTLGYPLAMADRIPETTEARNIELGLGLQVFYLLSPCLQLYPAPLSCSNEFMHTRKSSRPMRNILHNYVSTLVWFCRAIYLIECALDSS